jgi:Tlde1 domain
LPQTLFGGLTLATIALAAGWTVYANVFATRGDAVAPPPTVTLLTAKPAAPAVTVIAKHPAAATKPNLLVAPRVDVALFHGTPVGLPRTFAQSAPLGAALQRVPPRQIARQAAPPATQTVAAIPLPVPRPRDIEPTRNPTLQAAAQRGKFALASAESTPVAPSMFDKIFGKRETTGSTGSALAYAAPDGGVSNDGKSMGTGRVVGDGQTAVYDIAARTVYMPDGTRLEAHSGLREHLDDPRYVNLRMRGATPPHTYELTPRETLFHGVPALRLIPVGGEGAIFGRSGLLAHTYMLGPNGDSNGCVSFKDYYAFLRAYQNGKVKRLVVVAHGGRSMMASN